MNSKDNCISGGVEASSDELDEERVLHEHFKSSEMKRAAAKELIERYYYQVKDGCGNDGCTNDFCASSGKLIIASADHAAALALRLFQNKARLCNVNPAKMAKLPNYQPEASSVSATIASSPTLNDLASKAGLLPSATSSDVTMKSSTASASSSPAGTSHQTSLTVLPLTTDSTGPTLVSPSSSSESSLASTSKEPQSNAKPEKKELLFLTYRRVQEIVDICLEEKTFSLLIRTIGQVFCSADSLMISFRRSHSETNAVLATAALSKEDRRAHEADLDKDCDSSQQQLEVGAPQAHTKSVDSDEDELPLRPDEITLDLESLRQAYRTLYNLPDLPFQGALVNALLILFDNADLDLRFHDGYRRHKRHYLNIFVAVLEIPAMGHHLRNQRDPSLQQPHEDFVDVVLPSLCRAAASLPLVAQGKLARVLAAHYDAASLKRLLDALHQLITSRVLAGQMGQGHLSYCVNEDEIVMAATRTMKILFFAAILGGVQPTAALLEEEEEDVASIVDDSNGGPLRDLVVGGPGGVDAGASKERRPAREDPLARELGVRASDCRHPVLPLEDFYNEPLNDQLEVDKDFTNFKAEIDQPRFSFMNYAFILTPATKAMSLYYDNRVRMYSERRISVLQSMVRNEPNNPYLRLKVRRDHLISDALIELEMVAMENPNDLKKQLVVEFESEQGIDEGGVSKEFFQLVVDEIFNPDFGMFTLNSETQLYWFNQKSFETDGQFMLIGIVLGLAIYNNVILDIHLPHVVYRKLMNKRGAFDDLADLDPALHQGLVELKNYSKDDVEEVFMQTFQISYKDIFGAHVTHDLKENGDQIPVNNTNKKEFLDMYADYLLNKSIERQFRAFRRGFQIVTDESPLKWLFRPEEVELLVCGSNLFDFNALEESTEYDGGYTATTTIIRQFWEIVHDMTTDENRKLLQFTTGSDRAPVGGLSKLKLIISRNGPDSNRLPTAHTCFNVLLLPEYSSKTKLKDRLMKAITYSKGFGML